ncbi:MAG: protein phosphatase 2C domain-containing protein [Lachnospiraceae bacterium]|nr:protein phosphatase 2C domain-containing protein [Lachnospiraceae bacterium]
MKRSKIFAISQTGVSHLSADTSRCFSPCQDAYKIMNFSDSDILDYRGYLNGTILAVADGHGNPICHGSSEFGSRLAVEAAVECMMDLVKEYEKTLDANVFQYFPKMVVTIWRDWVMEHAKGRFPEQDLKRRFKNEQAYEAYEQRIFMDYGSTLLAAVAIPETQLLVAAQIGDGDLLFLCRSDKNGEVRRLIRGNPEQEFGSNRTDSLCMHDAEKKFQMLILDGSEDEAVREQLDDYVLMLATDGISSAALSDYHFLSDFCRPWMSGYMNVERKDERKRLEELFGQIMEKDMRFYSSDDMTVVLMAVNDRMEKDSKC